MYIGNVVSWHWPFWSRGNTVNVIYSIKLCCTYTWWRQLEIQCRGGFNWWAQFSSLLFTWDTIWTDIYLCQQVKCVVFFVQKNTSSSYFLPFTRFASVFSAPCPEDHFLITAVVIIIHSYFCFIKQGFSRISSTFVWHLALNRGLFRVFPSF